MTTQGSGGSSIVVRYCSDGDIELAGAVEDLRRLSQLLLSASPESVLDLGALPRGADAAPYDGFLTSIRVMRTAGKARVGRQDVSLVIEGSATALAALSQDIASLTTVDPGEEIEEVHIHIEHHDGHSFIAPDSEPLVINRLQDQDAAHREPPWIHQDASHRLLRERRYCGHYLVGRGQDHSVGWAPARGCRRPQLGPRSPAGPASARSAVDAGHACIRWRRVQIRSGTNAADVRQLVLRPRPERSSYSVRRT